MMNSYTKESVCVGCGCTDSHACSGGCYWMINDEAKKVGICSNCYTGVRDIHGEIIVKGMVLNSSIDGVNRPLRVIKREGVFLFEEIKYTNKNKHPMFVLPQKISDMKLQIVGAYNG